MTPYRRNIENGVMTRCETERAKHSRKEVKWNPDLSRLARNHSHRMSRKRKLWEHSESSKIPKLIKNPIEASIAWTLITLGFLVAWVFALIGVVILWVGREGYKKKKKEHVAVIRTRSNDRAGEGSDAIAARLYDELAGDEGYLKSVADPDFKLTGIGVWRKRNRMYITQIFYG